MQGINSTEYLKSIGVIQSETAKMNILTFSGKTFEVNPK